MSLLRRWIILPLLEQLQQGQSPERLALSLAFGIVISCCPLFGATTMMCVAAGVWFRLNHPAMQLMNQLGYPTQLALMIPFFRAGEKVFGLTPTPLSISSLIAQFRAAPLGVFKDYGMLALRGSLIWLSLAPLAIWLLYAALKPVMARLDVLRRAAFP